jgi:hypothetical protein
MLTHFFSFVQAEAVFMECIELLDNSRTYLLNFWDKGLLFVYKVMVLY